MKPISSDTNSEQSHRQRDGLFHFHLMDYRARAVVAISTDVVREAQQRHKLDPVTTIALGRALSCVALLASTLKNANDYVHGSISGDGLLKKVVAECNGQGESRGYTLPGSLLQGVMGPTSKLNIPETVGEAIGHGRLTVTQGRYGEGYPYNAVVDLANGEIATDFARYLSESEQIPSAVAAGVKLDSNGLVLGAGGLLVQRLGGAVVSDDELKALEEKISKINLSDRIGRGESAEELITYLQNSQQETWGLLAHKELRFKCNCSREKMAVTAMGLGSTELESLMSEIGKIEVNCVYCSSSHQFKLEELICH